MFKCKIVYYDLNFKLKINYTTAESLFLFNMKNYITLDNTIISLKYYIAKNKL